MTSAIWAYGSKLQLSDMATSPTFSDIAEIIELTPPSESRDDIDVTNMSSADSTKESIAGWKDSGECSFKANWLPTNATQNKSTGLRYVFEQGTNVNWKIILPSSVLTISFLGHLTALETELPLDGQAQISGTIKLSGAATWSV
jgi:predicted secreted protein